MALIPDNEFIHIYKSDYILGILFNSCAGDNLIPTFITLGILCAIFCNCGASRITAFNIKISLAFISSAILIAVFGITGINANMLEHRMSAWNERKRRTACKITRRRLLACRVYRCSCGRLYYIDYMFLLQSATGVIDYTVNALIVF